MDDRMVAGTTHLPQETIGLLAGWGEYPVVIARTLRARGCRVIGIGVKGHADVRLRDDCDAYTELGMGKLGAALRFFRRHQVTSATMAGKIHKIVLFQRRFLLDHFPDWKGVRTFFPHFASQTRDRKDDTLLLALVDSFQQDGIRFLPATDFLPELLVKTGLLTRRQPTRSEWKDIAFGWKLAKEMGRLDVGQSVAIKGRAVLAVEAVEGTDLCIRRAGELCESGNFTVVKVAKPRQDMRFDVPTIGIGTLRSMLAAGGRVLAIEAEKTILIDEPEVIAVANEQGLTIIAVDAQQLGLPADEPLSHPVVADHEFVAASSSGHPPAMDAQGEAA
jgi:hypothetical protein